MSARKRTFFGVIVLFAMVVGFLLKGIADDLKSAYRQSAEETLVDFSHLLAASVEADMQNGAIDIERWRETFRHAYAKKFEALIYRQTKRSMDLQVYITDARGMVLFDSTGRSEGQDFSQWRDVYLSLSGQYGARTSPVFEKDPDGLKVMYVAAPIWHEGKVAGVVSVGKPTASQSPFIAAARENLVYVGVITFIAFLFLVLVVTIWLTRPFGLTSDLIKVVRQEGFRRPGRLWQRSKAVSLAAVRDVRDVLTDRSPTEEYVQALTHELKSPLTAIRGAAELLREPLPDAQRERFTANISEQVQRLQDLADRLLELSTLEKRRMLDEVESIDVLALLKEAVHAVDDAARVKKMVIETAGAPGIVVEGNRFLLRQALVNQLANAVDFSPASSVIEVAVRAAGRRAEISVRDHGPGVPDYALERAFEKFYSLPRPDTGRKSTGLGLAFVREVAHLHDGDAYLVNHPEQGAIAVLNLPASFQGR
jgi:two-component system sensor histidine kinase CreC